MIIIKSMIIKSIIHLAEIKNFIGKIQELHLEIEHLEVELLNILLQTLFYHQIK